MPWEIINVRYYTDPSPMRTIHDTETGQQFPIHNDNAKALCAALNKEQLGFKQHGRFHRNSDDTITLTLIRKEMRLMFSPIWRNVNLLDLENGIFGGLKGDKKEDYERLRENLYVELYPVLIPDGDPDWILRD